MFVDLLMREELQDILLVSLHLVDDRDEEDQRDEERAGGGNKQVEEDRHVRGPTILTLVDDGIGRALERLHDRVEAVLHHKKHARLVILDLGDVQSRDPEG